MVFVSQESPIISSFIDISLSMKIYCLLQKGSSYNVRLNSKILYRHTKNIIIDFSNENRLE